MKDISESIKSNLNNSSSNKNDQIVDILNSEVKNSTSLSNKSEVAISNVSLAKSVKTLKLNDQVNIDLDFEIIQSLQVFFLSLLNSKAKLRMAKSLDRLDRQG